MIMLLCERTVSTYWLKATSWWTFTPSVRHHYCLPAAVLQVEAKVELEEAARGEALN